MNGQLPAAYYVIAIALTVLLILSALWVGWKRRHIVEFDPFDNQADFFRTEPWYKQLNLGAFLLTPLWLFMNGFWLTWLLYLFVFVVFAPLTLLFSITFLFAGTRWSWGDGSRWANNYYRFANEQYFCSNLALVMLVVLVVVYVAGLLGV